MKVERKSFPVRFRPELVDRIDAAKGPLSRNRWLEALVERELGALEAPAPAPAPVAEPEGQVDVAETGEPSGLEPMDAEPVADPLADSDPDLSQVDLGEDWWR